MTIARYKSNRNVVYSCKYHVVFCPKYRRKVLTELIQKDLRSIILEICKTRQTEIIAMELMPDHVHILLEVDPQYGIHKLIKEIKGKSSFLLRGVHLSLRSRLPTLWTHSYFVQKKQQFQNLLADHGKRMGVPSHTLQGMLLMAWDAWDRCFKKISKKPRLKGVRNKLNSIPFPDPIKYPVSQRIKLPGLGTFRFHKQDIPEGKIKCGRIVKRASGWYLCLFIDVDAKAVPGKANGKIGIDPGYKNTLTLSTGETICMSKEFQKRQERLAGSEKGHRKKLSARLHERIKNTRKDNNHKLSRRLVAENSFIVFSKDNISGIARSYGKSVAEAGHHQLRQMLSYKCTASGRKYVEVDSKFSTMTCSHCLARTGPTGKGGLSVRQWECTECRTSHDRDQNAAINTLIAGLGTSPERVA